MHTRLWLPIAPRRTCGVAHIKTGTSLWVQQRCDEFHDQRDDHHVKHVTACERRQYMHWHRQRHGDVYNSYNHVGNVERRSGRHYDDEIVQNLT